jgi:long-subunit acyl-CoA synthetase (AMP-forming)
LFSEAFLWFETLDVALSHNSYIGDKKATQAAFDSEGFLKTEDLAKYHNGQYFLLGRENLDCKQR